MAPAAGGPPPAEALASELLGVGALVFALTVLAILVRSWQHSLDRSQAQRARAEALACSKARLQTISERNIYFEQPASGMSSPDTWSSDGSGARRRVAGTSSCGSLATPSRQDSRAPGRFSSFSSSSSAMLARQGSGGTVGEELEVPAGAEHAGMYTSRVLGSVPTETVTSTATVLAAFNFDVAALHRRESRYAWSLMQRTYEGNST